jgi:succinyl-CoA synthetase beta subunit
MFGALNKRPTTTAAAAAVSSARRYLSLHEHQAQSLLAEYGVRVPAGRAATSVEEVGAAVDALGGNAVLKSQILAGGRGKGRFDNGLKSGVHVVSK